MHHRPRLSAYPYRRCLQALAAGAALAGLLLFAPPARAQMAVVDGPATAQLIQEVQTAARTLSTLQQQYNRLTQTYEALSHPTSISGMMPGLSIPSVQNPLGNVAQVPGITSGANLGSVSSLAQQFANANRYYQPSGMDYTAQEMQRQAQATAGVQALAYQNLQATQARMNQLPTLQAQLDGAKNVQDVAAVNNRIQVEQQFVATQQAQAQQLQLLQQAQQQVNDQRLQQRQRQDADSLFNDTQALN
jgi:type IV secretion system protein VirB5